MEFNYQLIVYALNQIEFNKFQNDKKFNPDKINFHSTKVQRKYVI